MQTLCCVQRRAGCSLSLSLSPFIYLFVIFCLLSSPRLFLPLLLLLVVLLVCLVIISVFSLFCFSHLLSRRPPLFSLVILAAIILIFAHAFIYQFLRRKQAVSMYVCVCQYARVFMCLFIKMDSNTIRQTRQKERRAMFMRCSIGKQSA